MPLSSLAQPKRAGLVVYEGKYVFLADREPAREYLKANAESILAAFGNKHRIRKEDVRPSRLVLYYLQAEDKKKSYRSSSSLAVSLPRNGLS